MKKLIPIILAFTVLLSNFTYAQSLDETPSKSHTAGSAYTYEITHPNSWSTRNYSDKKQGLIPDSKELKEFIIEEFNKQTYEQVINSFTSFNTKISSQTDFIFKDKYPAKLVTYLTGNEEVKKTFVKRGSAIFVLPTPTENKAKAVYESFKFTDDWLQYIDYKENYTFLFPSSLEINTLNNGVQLSDPTRFNDIIFSILKYEDTKITDAPEEAKGANEKYLGQEKISFHGIKKAIKATYEDIKVQKSLSKIFLENNGKSYSLTNTNQTPNFPHYDYYDEFISEILVSFEFFTLPKNTSQSKFSDVKESNQNFEAILSLSEQGVIQGYQDKTFKPDQPINRAELTKLIVATVETPDAEEYKECFKDVEKQWYAPYICYAKEQEWVSGYSDKSYKPQQKVNRAEALKIILNVLYPEIEKSKLETDTVLDIKEEDWFYKYFTHADNLDLLDKQHIKNTEEGYYFYPEKPITRKEVAELIFRSQKRN